jgi:dihydroxyacid dehydratase/phosphogluconate dehydratase
VVKRAKKRDLAKKKKKAIGATKTKQQHDTLLTTLTEDNGKRKRQKVNQGSIEYCNSCQFYGTTHTMTPLLSVTES